MLELQSNNLFTFKVRFTYQVTKVILLSRAMSSSDGFIVLLVCDFLLFTVLCFLFLYVLFLFFSIVYIVFTTVYMGRFA